MRVLDMTQYEAGTACTQALAWLGADVVKIERPGAGDPGRGLLVGGDHSAYFLYWNANKRSVALDLEKPEGRALLLRMLPRYDVFVENFGPGVLEKLGLDYERMRAVQPTLIHARIKGFGSGGPHAGYKCYDMVAQAAAGAFSVTGDADGPPMCPGPTMADSGTGMQAALAITAAYVQRLREGIGQEIEIAMQEAMTFYMRTRVANGSEWGTLAVPRSGNGAGPMLNLYPCAPAARTTTCTWWSRRRACGSQLCVALERPDLASDPRFKGWVVRHENGAALYDEIAKWTRARGKHEAMRILAEAGVPASAVLDTRDLFQDPQLRARGLREARRARGARRRADPRLAVPALEERGRAHRRARSAGRHTDEVLRADLGLSEAELRALHQSGVIATKEPERSAS